MTRTHLVTFSDEAMSRSRALCVDSAMKHGCNIADAHSLYTLERMTEFHADWVGLRGVGYWHWKPVIISNAMAEREDGDIVLYSDAGVEFINNVNYIIDRMDQNIFLFGNNWEHAHWCKADVAKEVWPEWCTHGGSGCHCPNGFWERFRKQVQASVIFFRVSEYSRKFVKEWLDWCVFEGGRLIDDSPSRAPNHPEFQEHRHDQAILTTMAYREGIRLHWWPAVYNKGGSPEFIYEKLPEYAGDAYPVLFSHHRRRNHEWSNAA